MLSEKDIEQMIRPIIERQEYINSYVIYKIAQRIKEIGKLAPSDLHRLERLLKSGQDVREINKEVARITGMNERAIKKLIRNVAKDAYQDVKPYYDYRHKSFIPFEKNVSLQRVVTVIEKQTSGTYVNLSKARAFMIRDLKNPLKLIATSLSKAYYSVVDEAIQAVQSGTIDYGTAMRRVIQQLVDSGIRTVEYHPESGKTYTQELSAAVKRNLLDGIRQINQGVQDEVGKQFGADGKELTVHEMSAPDHEPIQGHQFTNEEYEKLQSEEPFEDVNGRQFEPIKRAIGEYNCRHFAYSIIVGVNKPVYTQEQLDANIARNHKGYTDSKGKHRTLYECSQEQRRLEREIRKTKQTIMAARAAGNDDLLKEAKADLAELERDYKEFSKACGLSQRPDNTRVAGYKR